jgi:hypothetical protein
VEYGVGYEPYAITAADFNGDGKMDIATANYLDGTASVLLNRGNGKFNTASNYATGHPFAPYGITAASWDPGSKPSLALATAAGTFVLVNKGDGTFRPALGYDPPAIQVVSMDLNNDGKADLIVAGDYGGEGNGGLTMLFGKGRGVFTTAASYVAVPNLEAVAVGDFNGDGIPDLAVVDANDRQLAIMLGLGKGRFSAPVHYYNAPGYPSAIVAGDFNRDGKLDVAVASDSHQVYLYLGNGDGSFTMGNSFRTLGQYPGWMTAADFNGDGILDIAVTSAGDFASKGAVSILLGKGDGTFKPAVGYGFAQYQYGLAVADFNRDGKLDFAVANYASNSVSVFLGDGSGRFKQKGTYPAGSKPIDLATADFNNDGNWDLATASDSGGFAVLLGNGDGSFGAPSSGSLPGNTFTVSAADFDGDGNPDLAVMTHGNALVYLLRGKGDGTFEPAVGSNIGTGSRTPAVADLNGDGALDFVVPNYEGGEVTVLLNRCAK